jgi:hypothetical protein
MSRLFLLQQVFAESEKKKVVVIVRELKYHLGLSESVFSVQFGGNK